MRTWEAVKLECDVGGRLLVGHARAQIAATGHLDLQHVGNTQRRTGRCRSSRLRLGVALGLESLAMLRQTDRERERERENGGREQKIKTEL